MIRKALMAAAIASAAWSVSASACQYPYEPEPIGWATADYFSKGIVAASTTVDLVVAERSRTVPLSRMGAHPQLTTFRVLQRLKGGSPDRFTLFTAAAAPGVELPKPAHMVGEDGRVLPFPWPTEAPPGDVMITNSCSPGFIVAQPGQMYLVSRDAQGRLVTGIPFGGGQSHSAFSFVRTGLPRFDPWYDGLFLASAVERERPGARPAPAPPPPNDRVATLVFQRPQSPAAVAALLKRVGATPFAVHVAAGEFVDETRMPIDRASASLLIEAMEQARLNLAVLSAGPAAAKAALAKFEPYYFENDGWVVLWTQALLDAEERLRQARSAGVQGIISVEATGTPTAWQQARREALIAEMLPGAVVNGKQAAPLARFKLPPPVADWGTIRGPQLMARLKALTGS